jgi:microcystin-dependent protein
MSDQYLGEIRIFAGSPLRVPDGWVLCDGRTLALSSNQALFALIGVTYGGDGVNTFAVPNLNGRVAIHQGQGTNLTSRAMGQAVGNNAETITEANLPIHNHYLMATTATASPPPVTDPTGMVVGVPNTPGSKLYATVTGTPPTTGQMNTIALEPSVGGSGAHNNLMPYQTVVYMMATEGLFPDFQ